MRVLIKSITIPAPYNSDTKQSDELPGLRDVVAEVIDSYRTRQTYRLPAAEVDGRINVGEVHELIFARREK